MNKQETSSKQTETQTSDASMLKTVLWIGLGVLVYICIQWMLPKVGLNS